MMKAFLKLKTLFLFCLLAVFIFSVAGFNENKEVQYIEAATSSCKGPADVMLVIDRSGTMGDDLKFSSAKTASVNFVDKLFSAAPTTSFLLNYHQIGLVAFNQNIDARQLKKEEDKDEIKSNINDANGILGENKPYPGYPVGGRYTDVAIGKARLMMKLEEGGNPDATKTMIILTDGVPNDLDDAKAQAVLAKNNDIRIIVVGLKLDKIADETDRDNAKEFIKYIASSPADCFYVYDSGEALDSCTSIDASELETKLNGVYDSITAAVCDESDPTISISKKPSGTLYNVDNLKITSTAIDDVGFKEHTIVWDGNNVECADLAGTTVACGAGECVKISCDTGYLGPFNVGQTIIYRSAAIDANDNPVNIDPPRTVTVANVDLDVPVLYRNKNNTIIVDISNYVYATDNVISISINAKSIDPLVLEGIEIDKAVMTCSSSGDCSYIFNTKNYGDGCLDWTDGITNGSANNIDIDVFIYAYNDDMGTRQIASLENQLLVSGCEGVGCEEAGTCSDGLNNDCDYKDNDPLKPIIDLNPNGLDEALCDVTGPSVGILRNPGGILDGDVYDFESDGVTPMIIPLESTATDGNGIKQHTIYKKEGSSSFTVVLDCVDEDPGDGKIKCNGVEITQSIVTISTNIGPFNPGEKIYYYSRAVDYSGNDKVGTSLTEDFIVKSRQCEGITSSNPTACLVNTSGKCCGGVCNSEISNPNSYNTVHCAEQICNGINWEWGSANDGAICSESGEATECYSYNPDLFGSPPGDPKYFYDGGCQERGYACLSGYCEYTVTADRPDACGYDGNPLKLKDYECSADGLTCELDPATPVENTICDVELDSLSINAYNNEGDFICGGSEATGEVLNDKTAVPNKVSLTAAVSDSNGIGSYKIYWQVDGGTWNNTGTGCGTCADGATCSCVEKIGAFSPGQVVKFYAWAKDSSPNETESQTATYSFTVRDHECYYINSQDDKGNIANLTPCNSGSGMCCGGTCDGAISATSYDEGCYVDSCSGTNWVSVAGNETDPCGVSDTCFDYYSPNVDFYSGCMNGGNECKSGYCVLSSSETFPSSCNGNLLTSYDCDDYETGTCKKRDTGTDIDCSVAGSYDSDTVTCNCDCNNYDIEEKIYSSLKFDGVNDYVDMGDVLDPGSNSFSVGLWFKWDGKSGENILYNKESLYEARVYNGYFHYAWYPNWSWYGGNNFSVNSGEWYYATVVYDKAKQYVYKNGELVYSRNHTGDMGSNSNKLLFGARGNTVPRSFFDGLMDDVRIYNRALYPEEVKAHYNGIFADDTGLVGHWDFDPINTEEEDGIAGDRSENENDGVLSNVDGILGGGSATYRPSWVSGKYGSGLDFDGSNDYVKIPSVNPTNAITVEMWAKSDTSLWNNYGFLVSKRNAYIMHPKSNTKTMNFYLYLPSAGGWRATTTNIDDITIWNHYIGTYNSSTGKLKLYVNGDLKKEETYSGAINSDTGSMFIGRDDGLARYFNGSMDEIRIYNRALSETEAAEHHKGVFSDNSGLIGYWDFNESSGTTAEDSSGNGPQWMKHYHGSATGAGGNVPENWQVCTDGKDNDCDGDTAAEKDEYDISLGVSDCDGEVYDTLTGQSVSVTATANKACVSDAEDPCAGPTDLTDLLDASANNHIEIFDINIKNASNDFTLSANALDDFLIYQTRIEWTVDNWGTTNSKTCNGTGVCEVCVEGGSCGEDNDDILSSSLSADNVFKFKVCAVDNSVNNNQKCTDEYAIEILSSNAVPVITPLSVIEPNFCLEGLKYILKWEFSDDGADAQASFEIQVEDVETGNLVVNKTFSASDLFYQINSDDFETGEEIEYGSKAYNWRVKVTDNRGGGYEQTTDWEAGPAFTTPPHEYPQFDFVAVPDFSDNCLYEIDAVGTDRCDYGENITFSPQNLTFIECDNNNDKQCLTTTTTKCDITNNICVSCAGGPNECNNFNSGGVIYVCDTENGVCKISGSCVTDTEIDCCSSDDDCMAADFARCDTGTGLCAICDDDSQCEKFNEENIDKGSLWNASSGGPDTLTDNSKLWVIDEWVGGTVKIIFGTGSNQVRTIISNTSEEITVDSNWTSIPNSSSDYKIIKYICNNEGVCEDREHRKWWFYGDDSLDVDSRDPHPINNYIESEVSDYNVILKIKDIFGNSCSRVKKIILGINKYPKWNEVSPSN